MAIDILQQLVELPIPISPLAPHLPTGSGQRL